MCYSKNFDPPSLSFEDWESICGAFKYTGRYLEISITELSSHLRKLILKKILERFGTIEVKSSQRPDFMYKATTQDLNQLLNKLDENIEFEVMMFSVFIQGAEMTLFNYDSTEVKFLLNPLDFVETSAKTELIEFMLELADCGKKSVVLQKDGSSSYPLLEALPDNVLKIFNENIPEDFV